MGVCSSVYVITLDLVHLCLPCLFIVAIVPRSTVSHTILPLGGPLVGFFSRCQYVPYRKAGWWGCMAPYPEPVIYVA